MSHSIHTKKKSSGDSALKKNILSKFKRKTQFYGNAAFRTSYVQAVCFYTIYSVLFMFVILHSEKYIFYFIYQRISFVIHNHIGQLIYLQKWFTLHSSITSWCCFFFW